MNITCPNCKTNLNVPDDKIPKERDSSFKCPKCRGKIQVKASKSFLQEESLAKEKSDSGKNPVLYSMVKQPALVCSGEPGDKKTICDQIGQMGFDVQTAADMADAVKKMEYHIYPLVVVDEFFDGNQGLSGLLDHMNKLDMYLRRRICLVLISRKFKTGDNMTALHQSVNSIIGSDGINHLAQILADILSEHKNFYTVYNESMKAAGKA